MKTLIAKRLPLAAAMGLSIALSQAVTGQEIEEVVIEGSLRSLPGEDIEIFGFGKSLLKTPRSASTISYEQMERFNVSDIDELVAFSPGVFTQSFFGVAGSLDVRGTPGETYFRGVKRLDNPGNYPTPIGASDRIDIVRGPASPIYGPAKVGGYLNFNPKSARAENGEYVVDTIGELSYTSGSWNKNIFTAEVGGPMSDQSGYYLYAEIEDSDSYYDNTSTDQSVLQASFDFDLTDKLRIQFGGMYHDYEGNQVAGWNRLSQDLIDNGTYVTGDAQPLDTDGDGLISHSEYNAVNIGGTGTGCFDSNFYFCGPEVITDADLTPEMALVNAGTTTLSGNQVLVAEDDTLENEVYTLYFDAIYLLDSGWEIKNQLFFEAYENLNENAYGFSQFHDSWVFEEKLVFSYSMDTDSATTSIQLSPSFRYTDFLHGDDFNNEFFDRRDLTGPSTSLDARLLSTRSGTDYSTYQEGNYMGLGLAALLDSTFNNGLALTLGVRYDYMDMESFSDDEKQGVYGNGIDEFASDSDTGVSWSASISYDSPVGLVPYITASEQVTIIAGQGADLDPADIEEGNAFSDSEMFELGVKGSFIDDSLYFAVNYYEQQRTDINAQATVTNNTTDTEGYEAELRWVVNDQLVLTAGYTNLKIYNVTSLANGSQFGFFGAEDLVNVSDPSLYYGGLFIGLNQITDDEQARKAGIPENTYSFTGTYDFQNGLAISGSIVSVDSTASGQSASVILPSYTLFNAGLYYEHDNWSFNVTGKNLTDERYFRGNFTDLFGSQIVLPELPRNFQASVAYKF